MEEVFLSNNQIQQIADKTAAIVLRHLKETGSDSVYVSVKEAARIIGVSVSHMYKIRDEYPHIRRGENEKGHIYFVREALVASLSKIHENK